MIEPIPVIIDTTERFPHLSRAPIVEAVIDFRARAEGRWEEADVTARLKASLPEYPSCLSLHGFSVTARLAFSPPGTNPPSPPASSTQEDLGWAGLRFESADKLQIAIFTRDGFSLSRLKPYKDWDHLRDEALRLWTIHKGVAMPSEIGRAGVRVINRLEVPVAGLAFEDYFRDLPPTPGGLATAGFLYHDVMAVPGYPYGVNLIRTFQPPETDPAVSVALLLDIDVYSPEPFAPEQGRIESRLAEMHWLKNRVFFGSVTKSALDLCR